MKISPALQILALSAGSLLFAIAAAGAQETPAPASAPTTAEPPSPPANEPSIQVKIGIYWWPVGLGMHVEGEATESVEWPEFFYQSGDELKPVVIEPGGRLPFFDYTGPATFTIFEKVPGPDETTVRKPWLTCKLPTGDQQTLLVVFPDPEKEGWPAIPVNVSLGKLPPGSVQVINTGSEPIAVKLSKKQLILQPNEPQVMQLSASDLADRSLKCAIRDAKSWRMVYSSNLNVQPDERSILIFYQQAKSWRKLLLGNL